MKNNKLQSLLLIMIVLFSAVSLRAQNTFPSSGAAGVGTSVPNASSLLDITSTTKGMLTPRMTKTQRDAIASPATGLLIYQTNSTPGFYYYSGTAWTAVTQKSKGWLTTGNSGTDPAINFIGTTDGQPLVLKVNSQKAGYLDFLNGNTGFGYLTLNFNTGSANTANGFNALYANTGGYSNTATGAYTLYYNTGGNYNTANGYSALFDNTTGYYNTATGAYALNSNVSGIGNTANGTSALRNNTGNTNTAIGLDALFENTTGYSNVAIGGYSLFNNAAGVNNVAMGDSALYTQTGGFDNTAVGSKALFNNSSTGVYNTANGCLSSYNNSTGYFNTASGYASLVNNTDGYNNAAFGSDALQSNTHGHDITAIGNAADVNSGSYSNSSSFGSYSLITASNQVRIGSSSVTSIGGYVGWSLVSDGRVKKNIKENVPGLAFINKLKPITYNLDLTAADKILQRPEIKSGDGKTIRPSQEESDARKAKEQIVYTGFIAQDVEKAAKSLNYDFSGVDAAKNEKDLYGLRYAEFVVPLVKAVQELSKINDTLKADNESLKSDVIELSAGFVAEKNENEELKSRLSKIETMLGVNEVGKVSSTSDEKVLLEGNNAYSLGQNVPNPFMSKTSIPYSLPSIITSASIVFQNEQAIVLKTIELKPGSGTVDVETRDLASGVYQYSLIIDGKIVATKQMELLK